MRYRIFGLFSFFLAACFALTGCDPKDVASAQAAAATLASLPNPFLMAAGTLASALLGSHLFAKAGLARDNAKEFSADEANSMAVALAKQGYVISRTPQAPTS